MPWQQYYDLNSPNRKVALRILCNLYANLRVFSSLQVRRKPCVFSNLTLNFFQKLQCHNHMARSPSGGLAMAMRCEMVFTLSCVPGKSYIGFTASLWQPHSTLTAAVQQTCGSCNNRECAVQLPPSLLAVTLQFFISRIVQSPCGGHNICDHYHHSPQHLTSFKNYIYKPQAALPFCHSMVAAWYVTET